MPPDRPAGFSAFQRAQQYWQFPDYGLLSDLCESMLTRSAVFAGAQEWALEEVAY